MSNPFHPKDDEMCRRMAVLLFEAFDKYGSSDALCFVQTRIADALTESKREREEFLEMLEDPVYVAF